MKIPGRGRKAAMNMRGPLARWNPAAYHGGVFHCARLTGARGRYTSVTKALSVTKEGNTNV